MASSGHDRLLSALAQGELRDELEIVRALRSPYCTAAFVEAVAASGWATSRRRILSALVRHPYCPKAFVWRALPQLGWHDLLSVSADPRAPMPVRRQAETKLLERVPSLSLGEKIALARQAGPLIIGQLLLEEDSKVIAALLENSKFSQAHCLRLVAQTKSATVLGQVARHPTWGNLLSVKKAILVNESLSLPLLLVLLVSLEDGELKSVATSPEYPPQVKNWAEQALWVRKLRRAEQPRYLH